MIALWKEGFDVVTAVRENTDQTGWFKSMTTRLFYYLLAKLSDHEVLRNGADFRLFDKKVADVIRNMKEQDLYLRGIFSWVGFNQTIVHYKENKRRGGLPKYTTRKMMHLALNGITSFSVKPLRLSLMAGMCFSLLAFGYGIYAFVALILGLAVPGWTSIIASGLLLSGVQLIVLGIIGEYLGRLFMAQKQRPHYIVDKAPEK